MPELLLHVGRPKAASSTIQAFLASASEALYEQQVIIPAFLGSPNQRHLAALVRHLSGDDDIAFVKRGMDHAARDAFCRRLVQKIERQFTALSPTSRVFISCEQLSSLSGNGLAVLRNTLKPYFGVIKVIVYLRRQDLAVVSGYNTKVLSGRGSLYAEPFAFRATPNLFYGAFLQKLADVFGEKAIAVRSLDSEFLSGGDVLRDLCEVCSLDASRLPVPLRRENESVSANVIEFVRRLNSALKEHDLSPQQKAQVGAITQHLSKALQGNGPRQLPSRANAQHFYRQFECDNKEVAQRWVGRRRLFSEDFSMYPEEEGSSPLAEAVLEEGVRIAAALCAQLVK